MHTKIKILFKKYTKIIFLATKSHNQTKKLAFYFSNKNSIMQIQLIKKG